MERMRWLYDVENVDTRIIFPKLYDGFLEIDEISKGENDILSILRDCVLKAVHNKLILTADHEKLLEYENNLGLKPQGGLDTRRETVLNFLAKSRVINEQALQTLAREYAQSNNIRIQVEPSTLTLHVWQYENTNDQNGKSLAHDVRLKLLPKIPQNLDTVAEIYANSHTNTNIQTANYTTLQTSLGIAR